MAEVPRISPSEARRKVHEGKALLVCGYEDREKFDAMHLENAISFQEFQSRLPSLTEGHEIIFYCA